ncbi:hypothetical protein [Amycolatopsis sp. DSM 110486]|uniref:hypothetical protein n=1 Tax=Amycolatopsis sp. DSM 110486 TaxID=2865832 RepID=UPI001C69C11E|nr:hypothetical protein [Amycolatopsis sp. DSM 110486]QYN19635.1 hypothetical protein K1T34_44725 [Amycolatopsis sp. DSM 110486]
MLPTGFALETPAQSIISVAYPKKLIVACKNVAMESWDKAVEDFKVDETFSAPALPGVDAQYGFCGAATDAPDARKCFLFLAHGDRQRPSNPAK